MADKRDFTDRFLKSIKPAPKGKRPILWDVQIPGFGLRVTPEHCSDHNRGTFVLVKRFPGKPNPELRSARQLSRYEPRKGARDRARMARRHPTRRRSEGEGGGKAPTRGAKAGRLIFGDF